MRRGKKGQSVAITFRGSPQLKAKIVAAAENEKRSMADFGQMRFEWIMEETAQVGSWEELQRTVSMAKGLKPIADAEDRSVADMLRLGIKWFTEQYERAGSWDQLKRLKVRSSAPAPAPAEDVPSRSKV